MQIKNYDIEIDGTNFYDQPFNDQIKKYDEIKNTATGQGDDWWLYNRLYAGLKIFQRKLPIAFSWS